MVALETLLEEWSIPNAFSNLSTSLSCGKLAKSLLGFQMQVEINF